MPRRPSLDLRTTPDRGWAGSAESAKADGSAEYRRRARRLRGQFAGRLGTLHAALGDLAREEDSRPGGWGTVRGQDVGRQRMETDRPIRQRTGDPVLSSVLGVASAPADRLAILVQESLSDGILPYPRRQDVLRAARRLGVGRFQANLIIAAVQHRNGTPGSSLSVDPMPQSQPRRARVPWGWLGAVVLVLALEAALVLGVLSATYLLNIHVLLFR